MNALYPGRILARMSAPFFDLVGPERTIQIGGVRLLGFNAHNAHKLLFTVILVASLYVISKTLRWISHKVSGTRQQAAFWARQGISLAMFILAVVGILSIWFDNPARLATGLGLVGAGLAFALQKVVTSFAGYFVILRGENFNVGDRISMGGVRGDVIALNFIQTVIMEMGEPPSVQSEDPGMWVQSRQYSGRIVTISNAQIFEEPIYNFTRDFPYIWEEMHIPVSFKDDRDKAEEIMLDVVTRNTAEIVNMAEPEMNRLNERFFIQPSDLKPRVYLRITDNWVELAIRFLAGTHDVRGLKDRISREILKGLESNNIGIASGTYEIVGFPPVKIDSVKIESSDRPQDPPERPTGGILP